MKRIQHWLVRVGGDHLREGLVVLSGLLAVALSEGSHLLLEALALASLLVFREEAI